MANLLTMMIKRELFSLKAYLIIIDLLFNNYSVVLWRRANKVGVQILVTPHEGAEKVTFGLMLRYDYTNTVATASENRTVTLNMPILINAGSLKK